MNQTVAQVQNAQEEYRRILRVHREREANLSKYTDRKSPPECCIRRHAG